MVSFRGSDKRGSLAFFGRQISSFFDHHHDHSCKIKLDFVVMMESHDRAVGRSENPGASSNGVGIIYLGASCLCENLLMFQINKVRQVTYRVSQKYLDDF